MLWVGGGENVPDLFTRKKEQAWGTHDESHPGAMEELPWLDGVEKRESALVSAYSSSSSLSWEKYK